jgi:condensation enzyme
MNISLRITGHVNLAVLQGALDDVVARHELLRTLVIRDADPPYQAASWSSITPWGCS